MTTWAELAARAEAASGADRELDADIWMSGRSAIYRQEIARWRHNGDGTVHIWTCDGAEYKAVETARFTVDVRATLYSIEERLPRWAWSLGSCSPDAGSPWACLTSPTTQRDVDAVGATPALALLAAYCRARGATGV